MHLKFQEINWDDKGLMYVLFEKDKKGMRWYPKWKDVSEIFDASYATETGLNREKLTSFFLFTCLRIITRDLLIKEANESFYELIKRFNNLADEISKKLLSE